MGAMLAAYLHCISPNAIDFPEGFFLDGIRWYGLSYLLGFLVGYWLIMRVASVGRTTLKAQYVGDLVVAMAIGIVVGGRMGYALFYNPSLFGPIDRFPWWGLLALNEGGMASHGGLIGGIIACGFYSRRHQHSWPHMLDLLAFGTPMGLFFGRIANFINGELYGRPCSDDFALAVKFPQEMLNHPPVQILQLGERFLGAEAAGKFSRHEIAERLIEMIQGGDQAVMEAVKPLLTTRHPSQLYEAVLEGLVVFLVLVALWAKPRKPLVLGGTFCLVYGVLRIAVEFFRQPDHSIGFQALDLTRGQWLSILPVAAGIILLLIFTRRNVEPMGGWLAPDTD